MINGTLSTQSLTPPSKGLTATAFFTCVEHAEAGQFSVPSFVLFGLPVETGSTVPGGRTDFPGESNPCDSIREQHFPAGSEHVSSARTRCGLFCVAGRRQRQCEFFNFEIFRSCWPVGGDTGNFA